MREKCTPLVEFGGLSALSVAETDWEPYVFFVCVLGLLNIIHMLHGGSCVLFYIPRLHVHQFIL